MSPTGRASGENVHCAAAPGWVYRLGSGGLGDQIDDGAFVFDRLFYSGERGCLAVLEDLRRERDAFDAGHGGGLSV